MKAARKVLLLCYLFKCTGKGKIAHLLEKSFQAFNVQNSRAYDRSMICSVDNGRALVTALSAEDRKAWPIIWEPSVMSWSAFGNTFQAGVRGLLFKMRDQIRSVDHKFEFHDAADPSLITGPISVRAASSVSFSDSETVADPGDSGSEGQAVDVAVQIDSSTAGGSSSSSSRSSSFKNSKDVDAVCDAALAKDQGKRAFKQVSCINIRAFF